jgi:hypothetical protein
MTGSVPPSVPCGAASKLKVRVLNQAYVTALLEARLIGDSSNATSLEFHPKPLNGKPEEIISLRIKLQSPGVTDLTISFNARGEKQDLGGRDRVHFLMQCKL